MSEKDRLTYRPEPETRRKIEQWYEAANCRSMNEFIDKAANFYADYLAANDNNTLLPTAILSAMNGRMGLLEKNLSAMSFSHAVELDMLIGIIAEAFQFDQDDLKRRRAQSVRNVKATNGRISLEKRSQSNTNPIGMMMDGKADSEKSVHQKQRRCRWLPAIHCDS